MPNIRRVLNLNTLLKKKSYFLLGPRQTGKSFLIRENLEGVKVYNLLLREDFKKLSFNPAIIREELKPEDKIIVIDEIQKLPELLDEVHNLIETKRIHFLLTGSSARKLKKYGTNLLGGRARMIRIHPFVSQELGELFDLSRAVNYGLLPGIYFSDDPEADLDSYIGLYLQQEVANEGLSRNLPSFARFMEVAATFHAEQVDFTRVSNDSQIPRTTVHDYFQVLKDTLIGDELPCWRETVKRKAIATPKFYFFDWGVVRKLMGLGDVLIKSPVFGKAFESLIYQELRAYCDYHQIKHLHYWRTENQIEVDFIVNHAVAVEVKSSAQVTARDLSGLLRVKEEGILKRYILVYTGEVEKRLQVDEAIEILPYSRFLELLWNGKILE